MFSDTESTANILWYFSWEINTLDASLKWLCTHTQLEEQRKKWRSAGSCGATISLASGKDAGIAHRTGVLWWMDTGSLGMTGQEGEEGELPFVWEKSEGAPTSGRQGHCLPRLREGPNASPAIRTCSLPLGTLPWVKASADPGAIAHYTQ